MLLVVQMRAGARSIDMGEYEITDNGAAIGGQEPYTAGYFTVAAYSNLNCIKVYYCYTP